MMLISRSLAPILLFCNLTLSRSLMRQLETPMDLTLPASWGFLCGNAGADSVDP